MNWWLFVQLFLLILLVGLVVSAIIESAMRELYKCRDQNNKNQRHNWGTGSYIPKDSSES